VVCVDEGAVLRNSRVVLPFGIQDVSLALRWLERRFQEPAAIQAGAVATAGTQAGAGVTAGTEAGEVGLWRGRRGHRDREGAPGQWQGQGRAGAGGGGASKGGAGRAQAQELGLPRPDFRIRGQGALRTPEKRGSPHARRGEGPQQKAEGAGAEGEGGARHVEEAATEAPTDAANVDKKGGPNSDVAGAKSPKAGKDGAASTGDLEAPPGEEMLKCPKQRKS